MIDFSKKKNWLQRYKKRLVSKIKHDWLQR